MPLLFSHQPQPKETGLDLRDLQSKVIAHWDATGEPYRLTENVGFSENPFYMTTIRDEYDEILDDPMEMINILGFSCVADYLENI